MVDGDPKLVVFLCYMFVVHVYQLLSPIVSLGLVGVTATIRNGITCLIITTLYISCLSVKYHNMFFKVWYHKYCNMFDAPSLQIMFHSKVEQKKNLNTPQYSFYTPELNPQYSLWLTSSAPSSSSSYISQQPIMLCIPPNLSPIYAVVEQNGSHLHMTNCFLQIIIHYLSNFGLKSFLTNNNQHQ